MDINVNSDWVYDQSAFIMSLVHGTNLKKYVENEIWYDELSEQVFLSSIVKKFDKGTIEPDKKTILHIFIEEILLNKRELYYFTFSKYEIRNSGPEEYSQGIFEHFNTFDITSSLKSYLLKAISKHSKEYPDGDRYVFDPLFDFYDELFEKHKKEIVYKIWSTLFSNHLFIYNFNLLISKHVNKDNINVAYFDGEILRRKPSWPRWVKNAVDFKYSNHCFYCNKDLGNQTRLLESREKHYDHIISLKQGGTNDLVNLQLLCDKCNLRKATKKLKPNNIFVKYID